jgi:DNA-binding IclR family transcriptional regulator
MTRTIVRAVRLLQFVLGNLSENSLTEISAAFRLSNATPFELVKSLSVTRAIRHTGARFPFFLFAKLSIGVPAMLHMFESDLVQQSWRPAADLDQA